MSERMSKRLSETMVEICRYLENRFGKGSTVSSQLTRFGVKALPEKGYTVCGLLVGDPTLASVRKARHCLAFWQRELFKVFAKFEPSLDIDASGSNLDQNLDRADPDPIQIDAYPEGDLARRLLLTIRRNPLISRKLLAIELSVSERKIRDSLKILKNSGLIARQGPDHGGIWRISRRVAPAQGESAPAQGGNAPAREENAPAQSTGKQISNALEERIGRLGRHVKSEILQGVIVELCKVRPMSKDDLMQILGRKERTIKKLVTPLLGKELDYLYPMMVHHPRQAYVASGKRKGTA